MPSRQKSGSRREPIHPQDAIWLQDSPRNRMIVNSMVTLDRMDLETLREAWRERVLDKDGGRRYPRFTLRAVQEGGRWFWEPDPDFDLARHIVSIPDSRVDTKKKLESYIATEASRPLPEDRPLWQIQHVHRFEDGGSAVIMRFHHCLGDGGALVPVLLSLMDDEGEAATGPPPGAGKRLPDTFSLYVLGPLLGPAVVLQKMFWRADRSVLHGPRCSGVKAVAWSEPIPLDAVRRTKDHFDVTVNDLLMTCVAGAFQRYFAGRSAAGIRSVRVTMPIDVRTPGEPPEMKNKFAPVLVELPLPDGDPAARIAAVKRRLDAMKGSVEPVVIYVLVNLMLELLPGFVSRWLLDFLANKCTCVATNVPGPRHTLRVDGRRLRGMMFWVPQRADIGIGLSILSFSGQVQIGLISDRALMPDPAAFVEAFEAEFATFAEAAEA